MPAPDGSVAATAEKQVASPFAIAGCYLFAGPATFRRHYESYRRDCPYAELFVSGLYNTAIAAGERVVFQELKRHVAFGTPDEMRRATPDALSFLAGHRTGRL